MMTVPQNQWWITDKLDAGQRKKARMDTKTIDNMVSLHRVKEKIITDVEFTELKRGERDYAISARHPSVLLSSYSIAI